MKESFERGYELKKRTLKSWESEMKKEKEEKKERVSLFWFDLMVLGALVAALWSAVFGAGR